MSLSFKQPAPAKIAPDLCTVCRRNPKYFDGKKTHAFCGRTCAAKAIPAAQGQPAQSAGSGSSRKCLFCHAKPRCVQGNKTLDHCSMTCANKAMNQIQQNPPARSSPGNGVTIQLCSICKAKPRYFDGNKTHDYCSRKCAQSRNSSGQVVASQRGSRLVELPTTDKAFRSVVQQFEDSWRHLSSCPKVRKVYKIISDPVNEARYVAYRHSVEQNRTFLARNLSAGNENRRWHGTLRACNIGDNGQTQLCGSKGCPLCAIIKTSFDMSFYSTQTGKGRFGRGHYTSSTSSKSNDYSRNGASSTFKALLLNKVVVGRGIQMEHDDTSLTAPPAGYDSVLGEVGKRLNYDELIVYKDEAILPSYLVIYDSP